MQKLSARRRGWGCVLRNSGRKACLAYKLINSLGRQRTRGRLGTHLKIQTT